MVEWNNRISKEDPKSDLEASEIGFHGATGGAPMSKLKIFLFYGK
jgi:hypothetical protein